MILLKYDNSKKGFVPLNFNYFVMIFTLTGKHSYFIQFYLLTTSHNHILMDFGQFHFGPACPACYKTILFKLI